MPSALPDGDPVPPSGGLPASALAEFADPAAGPFGVYVHVPFCRSRCGYCDFTTFTPRELGVGGPAWAGLLEPGGPAARYVEALAAEIDLAASVLPHRNLDTVFVGGGTPTLLRPSALGGILARLVDRFGSSAGLEVTVEANPDTVDASSLDRLAEVGVTRVSLGMQSAVPHVLSVLERTHRPEAVAWAVRGAQAAGLATSVDLIYGTPGESLSDWRASLEAAIALQPDHISAYGLTVEDGTRLAAKVRRGLVPAPQDDDEATKYELADELLTAAGYAWYEISNWTRTPRGRCRHNDGYWRDGHWWGFGPGAHGHVGGVRWWNVRHPNAYASRLSAGESPGHGLEVLTPDQRYVETVLLRIRLADGLPLRLLRPEGRAAVERILSDGLGVLIDVPEPALVLTRTGRLLADGVVHRLLPPAR